MSDSSRMQAYYRKQPRTRCDPEAVIRERIERQRQEYRDAIKTDCPHGPRVRYVTLSGGQYAAGLKCPADNPGCPVRWLSMAEVLTEWRDSQPDDSPADGT